MFTPKLLVCLREGYGLRKFLGDLAAGVTVGVVAIPLAMAFAIASGVTPDRGLFTAIIAGFIISVLGGSRVQIGGPTGAFVVIIYSIVQRHGYDGLAVATLMAGVIIIIMGLARFGNAIQFIPFPVITGFTSGIALIIFSSQIKDFFGLTMQVPPAGFVDKWESYLLHAENWNPSTTLLAFASLILMLLLRRYMPKVPAAIVVVVTAAAMATWLHLPVETIGTRFGGIPQTLPHPSLPELTLVKMAALLPDALTIAMLCAIESLLSAVVADGMTGYSHKSNMELVAQGLANIASACFGGIAATGAIARTATNIKSGATTPVAGIIHTLTIVAAMWWLAPYAVHIPLAALAAILVVIAWNMAELHHFINLLRAPKSDISVLLVTFFLTVFVDLTLAVATGMVLASLLFMKRMSELTQLTPGLEYDEDALDTYENREAIDRSALPEGVEVYALSGPFFFGAADRLKTALKRVQEKPKIFILRLRQVPVIDASGLFALEDFARSCLRAGIVLIFCEVNAELAATFRQSRLDSKLGAGYVLPSLSSALEHARTIIASNRAA